MTPLRGAKKTIFTAYHSGKPKLVFASPDVISTSPKNFLTSRIDFTVLLLFEFLKKKTKKQSSLAMGYQTLLSLHAVL